MDSHGPLPLLCILYNTYTKATVSSLRNISKHRSTTSNKLYMKRLHCIFNATVKESALKRHFIFHFCICLRNFVAAFDTICAFQSSVKVFHWHPSWKAYKIYVYLSCKLLVLDLDLFQQIVSKLWHWMPLPSVDCRDSQDQPDKLHWEPAPILVSSILIL